MAAISETLRQARLRSGIDLDGLASKTKINLRYLQAIEAGNFGELPSGIFARMFVKQYADAVGLDGASLAQEFQRATTFGQNFEPDIQTIAASRSTYHPNVRGLSSVGDRVRGDRIASMLSSFIWVLAAILVCAGAYYGFAHLPSRTAVTLAAAPHPDKLPQKLVAISPQPAAQPDARPAVPVPESNAAPSSPIQLEIHALEPVWITANADGKNVFSELVPAGASKTLSATGFARLMLGNAGGAEITFNGKKLEALGPKGQVRTADFTPQGFQVISRTSPSPEPSRNPDPLR